MLKAIWQSIGATAASKKVLMAITGAIVGVAARKGFDLDPETTALIVGGFIAAIFGQGLADHGKEKAKIEAANPAPAAPAVVQQNINEPAPSKGAVGVAMIALFAIALGAIPMSTGCATHDARRDTIHATFVATSTAADAFATYSAQHQLDIVAAAKAAGKTKDEARAELDDFRVKRDHVIDLLLGVLGAASIADKVNDDQSTATLLSAALQFHAALSDATGGKIQ